METVRLARDPHDRWIGGVCGGIARWLGWNSGHGADRLRAGVDPVGGIPGDDRLYHPVDRDAAGGGVGRESAVIGFPLSPQLSW